jgi:hypothetical protein
MNTKKSITAVSILIASACWAAAAPDTTQAPQANAGNPLPLTSAGESSRRAERRYDEMLGKMQAAVEEIAQLYGNPVFLQVFTNDAGRATELKRRLRADRSGDDVRREIAGLEKKRDELRDDIALKERESTRLATRLVRQRAALDGLAEAVDQARKAVEETAR